MAGNWQLIYRAAQRFTLRAQAGAAAGDTAGIDRAQERADTAKAASLARSRAEE